MTTNEFKQAMLQQNTAMVAYARKKKIRKIIRVILINALIVLLTLVTLEQMNRSEIRLPILITVFVVCVFYTLTANPRGLIFARPYVGVIECTEIVTHAAKREDNFRLMTQKNFTVLSIRTEDGKLCRLELDRKYESYYRRGDQIGVWSGLSFPILLGSEERATVCWWCGSINRPEDHECLHCGRDRFQT